MATEFTKYQHIEKIGSGEVEGILDGTCYLFHKIDGTNSSVWYDDKTGGLAFGSRNRELSLDADNQGFMREMTSEANKDTYNDLLGFLSRNRSVIVYGEWLVPVNIKRYKDEAWRHFYVFDVLETSTGRYWTYEEYKKEFDSNYPNIKYIPLIAKLEKPSVEQIRELLPKTGEFLISTGVGEGIVIKNYDFVNRYGRRTWAKMLTEDFLAEKFKLRSSKKVAQEEGSSVERDIIKLMTVEHVIKEKTKIMELHNDTGWTTRYTFELLNRAFNEFWRDNWENILKKFHNPTINFRTLKQLSDEFVKSVVM